MGDKFPGIEAYWVGFFAVDKEFQGQGIGYALLRKPEDDLKKKNINQLWVSSVPQTVDYYIRQGFKPFMTGIINNNLKHFLVIDL